MQMKEKYPKIFSEKNCSFQAGNLLSHPSGLRIFKHNSTIIAQQRHKSKALNMLLTPIPFENLVTESEEELSDIENPESEIKTYKIVIKTQIINGQEMIFKRKVERKRYSYSQIEIQEDSCQSQLINGTIIQFNLEPARSQRLYEQKQLKTSSKKRQGSSSAKVQMSFQANREFKIKNQQNHCQKRFIQRKSTQFEEYYEKIQQNQKLKQIQWTPIRFDKGS